MRRGRGIGVLASGKFDAVLPPLVCLERLVCVVKRRAGVVYLLLAALCSAASCTPSALVGRVVIVRLPVDGLVGRMLASQFWSSSPPQARSPCVQTVPHG